MVEGSTLAKVVKNDYKIDSLLMYSLLLMYLLLLSSYSVFCVWTSRGLLLLTPACKLLARLLLKRTAALIAFETDRCLN